MSLTGLAFLVAYAAGCLLALARHPIFGLMTYVATFYLSPPDRWWGETLPDLRWSLTAAGVTLLAVLIQGKKLHRHGRLFSHSIFSVLVVFVGYLYLQLTWALNNDQQIELVTLYSKYILLMFLIYRCVDTEEHLRWFLWTHVMGCLYLGWIVYTTYTGGRFEGFGGPDINEANAGALQIVTGIFAASVLFLWGNVRIKALLVACMPFIVNALVATVSRGSFLAAAIGGLAFNRYTPKVHRRFVKVLSVLAVVLFLMLTNKEYWERVQSITYMGEQVKGEDTGHDRLVLMEAQWKMFQAHPFGCGHRCTATLSPLYVPQRYLTGEGDERARSSHNTFMTMLVEHGIPGVVVYVMMVWWVFSAVRRLWREKRASDDFQAMMIPMIAAVLTAVFVGDLFVDYLIMEVRIWFITILMVLLDMQRNANVVAVAKKPASGRRGAPATPVPVQSLAAQRPGRK